MTEQLLRLRLSMNVLKINILVGEMPQLLAGRNQWPQLGALLAPPKMMQLIYCIKYKKKTFHYFAKTVKWTTFYSSMYL